MKKRPRAPRKSDPSSKPVHSSGPPVTKGVTKGATKGLPKGAPKGPPKGPPWLFGRHAVMAALANPMRHCHQICVSAEFIKAHGPELEQACQKSARPRPAPRLEERTRIEEIAFGGPSHHVHQGIVAQFDNLAQPALEDLLRDLDDSSVVVMLDQASDPQNIGAILRSCAAFGAKGLIMQDRHAPDLTPALAKVACGAVETIPVFRPTNLARAMDQLKDAGFWCVGLEGGADQALHQLNLSGKTALIMGAEGQGLRRLSREKCDLLAQIPILKDMESLNLSNASAISLYEIRRQFLKAL